MTKLVTYLGQFENRGPNSYPRHTHTHTHRHLNGSGTWHSCSERHDRNKQTDRQTERWETKVKRGITKKRRGKINEKE